MDNKNGRIGLALSGGGFRAAAFHLGTLNKLQELGILERVSVLSTISGGSITGSYYSLHTGNFDEFKKILYSKLLTVNIIREIFTSRRFIVVNSLLLLLIVGAGFISKFLILGLISLCLIAVWKWQFKILPISAIIEGLYDRHFFNGAQLGSLPDNPVLAINATNLQTGRLFTFSKRKMDDSEYAYRTGKPIKFKNTKFSIARAVMASTCVPHFFSPVTIAKEFFADESDMAHCKPQLIDGGIYDNQGIHKITHRGSSYECQIIITSDAGNKLPYEGNYNNNFSLLIRAFDLLMQRIKFLQMMKNIYQPSADIKDKSIAYLSLGWDLHNCIPGFIDGLKAGLIHKDTIARHNIPAYLLADIDSFRNDITTILVGNTGYDKIITRSPSAVELLTARNVKTSLKPIKKPSLDTLIKHAENITELQVKLYCPGVV